MSTTGDSRDGGGDDALGLEGRLRSKASSEAATAWSATHEWRTGGETLAGTVAGGVIGEGQPGVTWANTRGTGAELEAAGVRGVGGAGATCTTTGGTVEDEGTGVGGVGGAGATWTSTGADGDELEGTCGGGVGGA